MNEEYKIYCFHLMILAGMLLLYSIRQLIIEVEYTQIKHYQTWENGPTSQN